MAGIFPDTGSEIGVTDKRCQHARNAIRRVSVTMKARAGLERLDHSWTKRLKHGVAAPCNDPASRPNATAWWPSC
ncbi:hypothetical protein BLAT2472_20523 [Burkholderia latens]